MTTRPTSAQPLPWIGVQGSRFAERPAHRLWLLAQAQSLFDFYRAAFNPAGGFHPLDDAGRPLPAAAATQGVERQIHETARMVHCSAIASLLGIPGADRNVDHGMAFLWERHRDPRHGGYFWGVDDRGATNPTKQAYGHAFVLLAASSAKVVGHPAADRMLEDITAVLVERFWEADPGAASEEYAADWGELGGYRGLNSNMHLTEATMAAFEATGNQRYLAMAESMAGLIIGRHARAEGWRVAEHFDRRWNIDRDYAGNPMFRPRGTTPGHALEWSRLLVQLWELGARRQAWPLDAARALFQRTTEEGWDRRSGGFYYTLGWDGRPDQPDRYWWPCAEGIGAAAVLGAVDGDPYYEAWYRRIWDFVDHHFIDHQRGGWIPELDAELRPVNRVFTGKPDIYHALQACLIPLLPTSGSVTRGLLQAGARLVQP